MLSLLGAKQRYLTLSFTFQKIYNKKKKCSALTNSHPPVPVPSPTFHGAFTLEFGFTILILLLGALHHESSPRNRHLSCFLTFLYYVQSQHGLVGLGMLDTLKEERKERSEKQGHSAKGELKKRNWLTQSQDKLAYIYCDLM